MNRWHKQLLEDVEIACDADSGASVTTAIQTIALAVSEGVPLGLIARAAGLTVREVDQAACAAAASQDTA